MDYKYMDELQARNAREEMKKLVERMTDEQALRFVSIFRRHEDIEKFLTLLRKLS